MPPKYLLFIQGKNDTHQALKEIVEIITINKSIKRPKGKHTVEESLIQFYNKYIPNKYNLPTTGTPSEGMDIPFPRVDQTRNNHQLQHLM